jgi:hypothetical protein
MAASASQISETTALLAHDGLQAGEQVQNGDYGTNVEEGYKKDPDLITNWRIESKLLARYSTPLFVTYLLQYSFQTTTVIVAGRLGTNELGAVSLATMTANVTGLAIYEGLATSLDTLCSQAHGGGRKELVGLHMQRMVYLLWLVTIPIGAIWICSPWILEALVPEKELAQLAGIYLRVYLIGMPGFATFEAGKRLVQAQGDFTGSLVVLFICAPLNVFLNWLFVFVSGSTNHFARAGEPPPSTHLRLLTMFLAFPLGLRWCPTGSRHIEQLATLPPCHLCPLHRTFKPPMLARSYHCRFPELVAHGPSRRARCHDDIL